MLIFMFEHLDGVIFASRWDFTNQRVMSLWLRPTFVTCFLILFYDSFSLLKHTISVPKQLFLYFRMKNLDITLKPQKNCCFYFKYAK